ncbi:MAG: hypothetical protein ACLPJH_07775 [Myxococcaceae bacterium]
MLVNARLLGGGLAAVLAVSPVLAAGGANAGPPGASPAAPGMRTEAIRDRGLNLDAFLVDVPADWRFEGALFNGTGCLDIAFPAFRTSSPDGLTQLERLPRFDWQWGTAPWLPKKTPRGCLPLSGELSASEFLKRLSVVSGVEYVADVPVAAEHLAAQKKGMEQNNARAAQMAARFHKEPSVEYGDMAQAKVRYRQGNAPMEALLLAILDCGHNVFRNFKKQDFSVDTCSATVRVVRAAQGKLDGAVKLLQPAGVRFENPQWVQAKIDLQNRQAQQASQQMQQQNQQFQAALQQQNQQFQQSQAMQLQQHQQFEQSQAMKLQQHQEFLSTMQRGTDMSMQRAQQSSNAMHTAASDTVDYALGQQTVRDPNSGQLSKVSAGYSNTWLNATGTHSLQTDNPNANPNGYVQGNWTLQQQVHGDGTNK